jgi:hypothetical protein
MTEPNQDPEGPKFVRRIRRPARSQEPIHPEPSPAPSPAPVQPRPKRKPKQPTDAVENGSATSASQQLLDALQQVREMQEVVRQVQTVKSERVPFWRQHGILIVAVLMLAGFYLYQRWQPVNDADDKEDEVAAVERLPETLAAFYEQDRASKVKLLRELSVMTFPDDPAKLKWFNDQAASQLEKDCEPVINDLAEIIFAGKTNEAAEALEN